MPASADPEALRLLTEHNSWVVRGADGSVHLKWQALVYLMRENLLLAPLGWLTDLPSLRTAMARLYDAIGRQRRRLERLRAACYRSGLSRRSVRPRKSCAGR